MVCPASQRKISWQTLKVESDTLPQVNSGSESNMSATSSYGHGHGAVSDRDNDSISSTQDLQPDRSRKSKKRKGKFDELNIQLEKTFVGLHIILVPNLELIS